jgi:hypothetical protein
MLLTEYRRTWFFHLIYSLLFPVAFVFLVKMTTGSTSRAQDIFLLGGLLTTALSFGSFSMLVDKIGRSRQRHEFDYWITLPIPKLAFNALIVETLQQVGFQDIAVHHLWEIKDRHADMDALALNLLQRKDRSILHELTDAELQDLVDYIRQQFQGHDGEIIDQTRWTLWSARKA